MSMKVQTRQVDGVTILDLSGRITLGEGSVTIRDAVRDVLAKGSNKILLNLGDISYIDSSGIGELVSAFTTVKNSGGELKLLNLTKKVHNCLKNTKLSPSSTSRTTRQPQSLHSPSRPFGNQEPNKKAAADATAFLLGQVSSLRLFREVDLRRHTVLGVALEVLVPVVKACHVCPNV